MRNEKVAKAQLATSELYSIEGNHLRLTESRAGGLFIMEYPVKENLMGKATLSTTAATRKFELAAAFDDSENSMKILGVEKNVDARPFPTDGKVSLLWN